MKSLPLTIACATAVVALSLGASAALAADRAAGGFVLGTKKAATVRLVSTDEGATPKRVAVHANALVTLVFKVDQSNDSYQLGQSIFGPNFKNAAISNGQAAVLKFRAPVKPGTITFGVFWKHHGQFKYNGHITVVR